MISVLEINNVNFQSKYEAAVLRVQIAINVRTKNLMNLILVYSASVSSCVHRIG